MSALETLRHVTTGTITTMLLKKGIRHSWMKGPMPLVSGKRVVGPAFTLRFVPVREDLATPESWGKPISTRAAIEDMPEGCIAVADAMGVQRKHVNELCNGRRNVTAATALILARVFGNSPDSWLNAQRRTDLWEAMHDPRERERIERARPIGVTA